MRFFKKILIGIFIVFVGLIGVSFFMTQNSNDHLSYNDHLLYQVIAREGKKLGKKYHMSQCSIGGGVKDELINLMSFDFQRYGIPLNENEARRLIINCLNDYLAAVNEDEKLKPFLKNYPFKPENIKLGIFNHDPLTRLEYYYPYISLVKAREGEICYFTVDGESKIYKYKTEKYETYDEAVAILEQEAKASKTE